MAGGVHVIATTPAGTVRALDAARALTASDDDPIVLIVPHAGFQSPTSDVRALGDKYRQLADETGARVIVRLCVCRTAAAVSSLVPPGTDIIVGGKWRSWWPTAEQRLAWHLAGMGHDVRFMDIHGASVAPLRISASVSV